jgi:hypothetical protein
MDFIMGLHRTCDGYDSIWVIVDHLIQVAHFILVKTTYIGARLLGVIHISNCVFAWGT